MSDNHIATRRNTSEGYVVQVEGNGTVKFVSGINENTYAPDRVSSVQLTKNLENAKLFDKGSFLRRSCREYMGKEPRTKVIDAVHDRIRKEFNGFVNITTFKATITTTTEVTINEE